MPGKKAQDGEMTSTEWNTGRRILRRKREMRVGCALCVRLTTMLANSLEADTKHSARLRDRRKVGERANASTKGLL